MTSYLILALILIMCLMIFLSIKDEIGKAVALNPTAKPSIDPIPIHKSSNDYVEIKTYEKVTEHTERRTNKKDT